MMDMHKNYAKNGEVERTRLEQRWNISNVAVKVAQNVVKGVGVCVKQHGLKVKRCKRHGAKSQNIMQQ